MIPRALFIGIGFYDYEASIVGGLKKKGFAVDAFLDRPNVLVRGPLAGVLRRWPRLSAHLSAWHERRIAAATKAVRYDKVLVIKAADLSVGFLEQLRRSHPESEFVLYLWDSLDRYPRIAQRLHFFDRRLTFDRRDAVTAGLTLRPLFHRDDGSVPATPRDARRYDVSFVGWLHFDRLRLVRAACADAERQGLTTYVYLFTGVATWLRLFLRGAARDVHMRPLSHRRAMAINAQSRAILDFPHPQQSGLTMRAIEAVGARNKLITTAAEVLAYDFYAPGRVSVVSGVDPRVDAAFIRAAAPPLDESIRARYSLDRWLSEVLATADIEREASTSTAPSSDAH